jgi:LemA protein
MTVDELANAIGVTDNAIRLHLTALERDGLVRAEGVRREGSVGKPATLYAITPDGQVALSKAYEPVLSTLLVSLAVGIRLVRAMFTPLDLIASGTKLIEDADFTTTFSRTGQPEMDRLIALYNGLVHLKVRADSAWSDIDVQLKRRHDLIPNLVETVKGYAAHEKGTFENIAKWRSAAMSATAPADRAQAEGQLTMALKSLFAVAEAYPQLRANENFMSLQNSLAQIESDVQNARRYYNAVVRDYNTRIQSFPANLIAGSFGFQPRLFFELEAPGEREVPTVKF